SDLKLNDQVQVQGAPTSITASSLTVGELPDFLLAAMRGPGGGPAGGPGGGAPGAAPGGGSDANGRQASPRGVETNGRPQGTNGQPPAFATATGKVVSLNPLTIAISSEVSVVLKLG